MLKELNLLMLSIIAVFVPIQPMLIASLVLAIVDMIFGIGAAIKQKQPITSKALARTIGKVFLYEVALMVSFVAETYLLQGIMPVTKIVAGFIGAVELKSIFENLDIINGSSLFGTIVAKLIQSEEDKLK